MIARLPWVAASSFKLADGWYCGSCGLNGLVLIKTVMQPVTECCFLSFSRRTGSDKSSTPSVFFHFLAAKLASLASLASVLVGPMPTQTGMPVARDTVFLIKTCRSLTRGVRLTVGLHHPD